MPGAQVCAYDVDWFLWWRSTQLVSCSMTDANGEFTMKFRWCCGWWPWWWWRLREWVLDVGILERITKALPPELKIRPIPLPDPTPDLRFVEPLLGRIAGPAGPITVPPYRRPSRRRLIGPATRVGGDQIRATFALRALSRCARRSRAGSRGRGPRPCCSGRVPGAMVHCRPI